MISPSDQRFTDQRERAFTLIELIVVMGLLVVVTSVIAPRLAQFFSGRDLGDEGRRFVSLTQYGAEQSISEGMPMTLWIDQVGGRYGLRAAEGWSDSGTATNHRRIYDLSGDLEFSRDMLVDVVGATDELQIRFLPDGGIDTGSISNVFIEQPDSEVLWIARATNGLSYEIRESQRLK